jgi:hypothetical protein
MFTDFVNLYRISKKMFRKKGGRHKWLNQNNLLESERYFDKRHKQDSEDGARPGLGPARG